MHFKTACLTLISTCAGFIAVNEALIMSAYEVSSLAYTLYLLVNLGCLAFGAKSADAILDCFEGKA